MPLIKGYPNGSDITIMDTRYRGRHKNDLTDEWEDSTIDIIYKDNLTGKKHRQTIVKPLFEFYQLNEDVYLPPEESTVYMPKDKLHPVRCHYQDLKKTLAELSGKLDDYYDNIRNGLSRNNDRFFLDNRFYRADMHIEDYYRYEFGKRYTNTIKPLHLAYLDIETDGIDALGDFGTPEDSPINAVTYIDIKHKSVYTFLLRDPNNSQCKEFEDNLKSKTTEFFAEIKAFVLNHIGGWKRATRFGVIDMEYNIYFFDEEIVMLHELFATINRLEPDFVMAWNMAYDIPFIIDRIKFLGYDPADIMRHPDFADDPVCFYYVDQENLNKPEDANDFARIPTYTIFIDQMKQFAQRRKGQHAFPSYKLDDIGEIIARARKYDYHDICADIVDLPRTNYFIFVMYNIIDVFTQIFIEHYTFDITFLFMKCVSMNTRYSKAYRQTVFEYTIANKVWEEKDNVIIADNRNKHNPRPDRKFKGAYVADYRLNDDSLKMNLLDTLLDIYDNIVDFDYTALYPSTIRENNMSSENQIGKIFIPNALFDGDNRFGDIRYDRGGAFIEDFQSHIWLEFCERWLHLAGYADLIEDIKEFFATQYTISYPMEYRWGDNGLPVVDGLIKSNGLMQPFKQVDRLVKPFIKYNKPTNEFTTVQQVYLDRRLNGGTGGIYLCNY